MPTDTIDWVALSNPGKKRDPGTGEPYDLSTTLQNKTYDTDASGRPIMDGSVLQRPTTPWADENMRRSVDRILNFGGQYTDWIAQTEEARGQAAEDYLRGAVGAFDTASMDEKDIRRMMTTAGDRSAQGFKANMKNLRGYLGGAGITGGGLTAQLGTNYEAQRQFALTDAARTSYEKKVQMDSLDKTAKFQAQLQLANQMQRDPSVAPMDWLQAAGELRLASDANYLQNRNANKARQAQEQAGKMAAVGSVLGAVGSFI